MRRKMFKGMVGAVCCAWLVLAPEPAIAAKTNCRNTGSFTVWMAQFQRDAVARGISKSIVTRALGNITFDASIIKNDRRQGVFSQSFLKFSSRMVANYRLQGGAKRLKRHRAIFKRISQKYGVPGPIIVGFWGLETDFGANIGKLPVLRSLATLAYDCRRPALFRTQLFAALRIIERGDLSAGQMVGAWAGELGQTQFLPSDYLENGVDFDGNGRRDLLRSVPDVLASTAKLLKKLGWRPGQPWMREVRVPASMAWKNADLAIARPQSTWARAGVRLANGKPLPAGKIAASLLLPMGRLGPAFLVYANFHVYLKWNQSLTYSTTAAYFATRLAGAPKVRRGNGKVTPLSFSQTKNLQRRLARLGYDVGGVDGIIGAGTRAAVKAVQLRLNLPADSYPTAILLKRLGQLK
ncbi:MAG: lytic murein transglycosylase [Alphaproteobacteria bacterium]